VRTALFFKLEVYAEYAITMHCPGDYEVDHLIPLELGGSNSIKNLWPESHPYCALERASEKRQAGGQTSRTGSQGQLDVKTAQQAIAVNWIEAGTGE
jgi:hypothetical protein